MLLTAAADAADTDAHANAAAGVSVGGVTSFSATDYPGLLSTVVFVQGCPWRCGYCHNPHLQSRSKADYRRWADLCSLLARRQGLIDAVVFSGGEPCADAALASSIKQVRALGFKVGLHTAGMYPRRLAEVLGQLDWVALDVKGAADQYDGITGRPDSARPVFESLDLVLGSGVSCEVRTTLQPGLHTEAGVRQLAHQLHSRGVTHYALQEFRATGCSDGRLLASTPLVASTALRQDLAGLFKSFSYRTSAGY